MFYFCLYVCHSCRPFGDNDCAWRPCKCSRLFWLKKLIIHDKKKNPNATVIPWKEHFPAKCDTSDEAESVSGSLLVRFRLEVILFRFVVHVQVLHPSTSCFCFFPPFCWHMRLIGSWLVWYLNQSAFLPDCSSNLYVSHLSLCKCATLLKPLSCRAA